MGRNSSAAISDQQGCIHELVAAGLGFAPGDVAETSERPEGERGSDEDREPARRTTASEQPHAHRDHREYQQHVAMEHRAAAAVQASDRGEPDGGGIEHVLREMLEVGQRQGGGRIRAVGPPPDSVEHRRDRGDPQLSRAPPDHDGNRRGDDEGQAYAGKRDCADEQQTGNRILPWGVLFEHEQPRPNPVTSAAIGPIEA